MGNRVEVNCDVDGLEIHREHYDVMYTCKCWQSGKKMPNGCSRHPDSTVKAVVYAVDLKEEKK